MDFVKQNGSTALSEVDSI